MGYGASNLIYCEFRGIHSDATDGSIVLGYDTASLGSQIPTFRDNIASKRRGSDYSGIQCILPEERNPQFPGRAFLLLQKGHTGCGAHSASCSMGTGRSFPGVKELGLEAALPSRAEVKNVWSYADNLPVCLHDMYRDSFTFHVITNLISCRT